MNLLNLRRKVSVTLDGIPYRVRSAKPVKDFFAVTLARCADGREFRFADSKLLDLYLVGRLQFPTGGIPAPANCNFAMAA